MQRETLQQDSFRWFSPQLWQGRESHEKIKASDWSIWEIYGMIFFVFLSILVAPRIIQYPDEIVNVERPQKSLILPCKAEGIPRPTITWIKDGIEITPDQNRLFSSDGSLVILSMKIHYQGIYTCFAANNLGKVSVTSKVYLGQGRLHLVVCLT